MCSVFRVRDCAKILVYLFTENTILFLLDFGPMEAHILRDRSASETIKVNTELKKTSKTASVAKNDLNE